MGFNVQKRPQMLTVDPNEAEKLANSLAIATPAALVTSAEYAARLRKLEFTFDDFVVTMTDATTNGNHGGAKFADLAAGALVVLGAISNLAVEAAAGIDADAAVVGAVGTAVAGTDNATLTSTEANIIPSTAVTLTSSAGVMDGEFTTLAALNGTGTAVDLYLNFAVPGDDADANSTITVNGTVEIWVLWLGDND